MSRALISGSGDRKEAAAAAAIGVNLAGVELPSPILTASGCAAAGRELDGFFDITSIGAIVTKSIMLKPRSGRATPRMAETPSGMLNSIGLQGPGIDSFIENDLAWLNQRGARTIVSIAGETVDEYSKLAAKLRSAGGFDALEVNISCPNVADRGQVFACRAETAAQVIQAVRRSSDSRVPIFAKLSPDVTDIVEIADSVIRAGATGLSLINTLLGMVIDTRSMRPMLAGVTGGLSGPAVRPVAIRCIWQVREAFPTVPIIGMGGVRSGRDALEFILAGATAVSVGTAVFNDPSAPMRIHQELAREVRALGFDRVEDLIGYAHREPDSDPVVEAGPDALSEAHTQNPTGSSASDVDGLESWDFITE
jgi:dihydroorotate dehydrogenase (NAD+) catalytic subunit